MSAAASRDAGVAALPLDATLFFAVSCNPVGFHHFAAVEWLLRASPELERAVLILSNGIHPDPTKPNAEVDAPLRLEILRAAVEAVGDPERSFLARQAELAGERLRLGSDRRATGHGPASGAGAERTRGAGGITGRVTIWERELAFARAVRSAEHVAALRAEHPDRAARVHWFAGSDLVRRMSDPAIFSDADLRTLSDECFLHVLERDEDAPHAELDGVERARGVRLAARVHPLAEVPGWLRPFLQLSSTRIRRAAEAGDPLVGMLPDPAAAIIPERGLYRPGRPVAHLVARDGATLAARSQLELDCAALDATLAEVAARVAARLDARGAAGRPHTLGVVETSAGGRITAALAARSGASRHFRQARFAYDGVAKEGLIGAEADRLSAVSEEMVAALAQALRREARADLAVAESGMAGPPDGRHRSLKNGHCAFAWATPEGVGTGSLALHPFETRREHQLRFAIHALSGLEARLD